MTDCSDVAEQEKQLKKLEEKYSRIQLTAVVEKYGDAAVCDLGLFKLGVQQVKNAHDAELMTKERLCCGLNVFEMVLARIRDFLVMDTVRVCLLQASSSYGLATTRRHE